MRLGTVLFLNCLKVLYSNNLEYKMYKILRYTIRGPLKLQTIDSFINALLPTLRPLYCTLPLVPLLLPIAFFQRGRKFFTALGIDLYHSLRLGDIPPKELYGGSCEKSRA